MTDAATQINFDDLMSEITPPAVKLTEAALSEDAEETIGAAPSSDSSLDIHSEDSASNFNTEMDTEDSHLSGQHNNSGAVSTRPPLNTLKSSKSNTQNMTSTSGAIEKNGSLSIDMSGNVSIDLKLNFGEKSIFVSCDEEGLLLTLSDGSSFKIPLK